MKNAILPALFGLAAIAAVPAMASTVGDFDFTTGSNNSNLSSYGPVTATKSIGVTVTAYAFVATGTSSAASTALVGPNGTNAPVLGEYNGNGLGVCETSSGTVENCSAPSHQISDGNNSGTTGSTYDYEFTLLVFSTAVNLDQLQLGNFASSGTGEPGTSSTDPFGITYYTSTSALTNPLSNVEAALESTTIGASTLSADGVSFTEQTPGSCLTGQTALGGGGSGNGGYTDNCTLNNNGVYNLSGTGVTYLLIGAALNGNGQDYFKLQDIDASQTATPEPATFGMLGIAFVGIGLIFRKRK